MQTGKFISDSVEDQTEQVRYMTYLHWDFDNHSLGISERKMLRFIKQFIHRVKDAVILSVLGNIFLFVISIVTIIGPGFDLFATYDLLLPAEEYLPLLRCT